MRIQIRRIYEEPSRNDGYRVLIDRLWPRGLTREAAALDRWDRDVAPSAELRKRFHANPEDWGAFRRAYLEELRDNETATEALLDAFKRSRKQALTLLFASREPEKNHATVLLEFLRSR